MQKTVYQECYQRAMDVFEQCVPEFQIKSMMISRRWNAHFSYVMIEPMQLDVDVSLPMEIDHLQIEDIYINLSFSFDYLKSFLKEEIEKTSHFFTSSSCTEEELFSLPRYTAYRFNDAKKFSGWNGFSKDAITDLLWRIYALDGVPMTSQAGYMDFFCKTVQKLLDQSMMLSTDAEQRELSCLVADLGSRRLRDILLEMKK